MKVKDIIKLLDAGYTRDQIMELDGAPAEPAQPAAPGEPAQPAAPAEPAQPAAPAEPAQPAAPAEDPVIKQLLEQNKQLLDTVKQMQIDNIANARQDKKDELTTDSIIRNFINEM